MGRSAEGVVVPRATAASTVLLSVLALVPTACADPVHYDEAVSGDLADNFGAFPVFALDVGTNTVFGTTGNNLDAFAFVVPANHTVIGGSLAVAEPVGYMLFTEWEIYRGSTSFFGGTKVIDLYVHRPPGTLPIPALPADGYMVRHAQYNNPAGGLVLTNYTFTFN